jgi:hypothetical protein
MLVTSITLLIVAAIVAETLWSRHAFQQRLTDAWVRLQMRCLPATHVTIDHSQIGHIIPVNDDLLLIRHTSGRLAYLPIRRPASAGPTTPAFVRMLALVFFSL